MHDFMYFLISLLSSIIGGISGIGGGVIIKPALDVIGSMSVSTASFLSGCTVLSMTGVTFLTKSKGEKSDNRQMKTVLALGSAVGGFSGKYLFEFIKRVSGSETAIGLIQTASLLCITIAIYIYMRNQSRIKTYCVQNKMIGLLVGLLLGLLSAFLGIGGGPMNVAVLSILYSMDVKEAAKTSLYIILFSQITSLSGAMVSGTVPEFNLSILLFMIAGGVIGGIVGRSISSKVSKTTVGTVFNVTLFLIMAINIYHLLELMGML